MSPQSPCEHLEWKAHARPEPEWFRKLHAKGLAGSLLVVDVQDVGGHILQDIVFGVLCARLPVPPLQLIGALKPKSAIGMHSPDVLTTRRRTPGGHSHLTSPLLR